MPNGVVNPEGLAFYQKLIDLLPENEIQPVVTVFHFDLPVYIAEQGGWENRNDSVFCRLLPSAV